MTMNTQLRISRLFAAAGTVVLVLGLACAASAAPAAGVATARSGADRATQMLFDAVHTNDFAATEAAVAAGANVEARDRWNISAIELAIDKGYFRIAHFLVSVRNSRRPANQAGSHAGTQAAPAQPQAAATPPKPVAGVPVPAKVLPPQQAAQKQKVVAQPPQWPTDKPNPFDPSAPAFGTALPVVPATPSRPVGAAGGTDEGPMLATDGAIRLGSESLR